MKKLNFKKLDKNLTEKFNSITPQEIEEWLSQFPKIPHGWVDVNEHTPQCYAIDFIEKGYSVFKVRDVNGKVMKTHISDGMIWFHAFAQPNNITHWWNNEK